MKTSAIIAALALGASAWTSYAQDQQSGPRRRPGPPAEEGSDQRPPAPPNQEFRRRPQGENNVDRPQNRDNRGERPMSPRDRGQTMEPGKRDAQHQGPRRNEESNPRQNSQRNFAGPGNDLPQRGPMFSPSGRGMERHPQFDGRGGFEPNRGFHPMQPMNRGPRDFAGPQGSFPPQGQRFSPGGPGPDRGPQGPQFDGRRELGPEGGFGPMQRGPQNFADRGNRFAPMNPRFSPHGPNRDFQPQPGNRGQRDDSRMGPMARGPGNQDRPDNRMEHRRQEMHRGQPDGDRSSNAREPQQHSRRPEGGSVENRNDSRPNPDSRRESHDVQPRNQQGRPNVDRSNAPNRDGEARPQNRGNNRRPTEEGNTESRRSKPERQRDDNRPERKAPDRE